MSEAAKTEIRQYPEIPEVPERGGISGAVVRVRLAVALGVVALAFDLGLLWVVIAGTHLWWGALLAVVGLGLSGLRRLPRHLRRDPLRPVHRGLRRRRGGR